MKIFCGILFTAGFASFIASEFYPVSDRFPFILAGGMLMMMGCVAAKAACEECDNGR